MSMTLRRKCPPRRQKTSLDPARAYNLQKPSRNKEQLVGPGCMFTIGFLRFRGAMQLFGEYPSQHAPCPIMLIINPIMHLQHETETRLVAHGVVEEWDQSVAHLQKQWNRQSFMLQETWSLRCNYLIACVCFNEKRSARLNILITISGHLFEYWCASIPINSLFLFQ